MGWFMRTYELMTLSDGRLDEQAVNDLTSRFTKLIADQGGNVQKVDQWGKRELAYEINHQTEGHYTVVDFDISADGLKEVQRQLGITDGIVRYKIVRPGTRTKRTA